MELIKKTVIFVGFSLMLTQSNALAFEAQDIPMPAPVVVWPVPGEGKEELRFRVDCDLEESQHKNLSYRNPRINKKGDYRVKRKQELYLVRKALHKLYPRLPGYLQETARQVTFMVDHTHPDVGDLYVGWSAEDDPAWEPGDGAYYPEGTIKVNLGPRLILALLRRNWKAGEMNGGISVIAHELMHAWQYHKRPIVDLARTHDSCPEGLCRKKLIAETKLKIEYERDAYGFEKTISPDAENWNEVRERYEVQYALPLIAWGLKNLAETDPGARDEAWRRELGGLLQKWKKYADVLEVYPELKQAYPYLFRVEKRILGELARLNIALNRTKRTGPNKM